MSTNLSAEEIFEPIKGFFQNATTNEDYREATKKAAHHVVQAYFDEPSGFKVVDHGELATQIDTADGTRIAEAADTLLLEVQVERTGATLSVLLAVNANADDKAVISATIARQKEILAEWRASRGLEQCWAMAMVRKSITFSHWIESRVD